MIFLPLISVFFREFIFPTPLIERLIEQDEFLIIDFESFKQLCNS